MSFDKRYIYLTLIFLIDNNFIDLSNIFNDLSIILLAFCEIFISACLALQFAPSPFLAVRHIFVGAQTFNSSGPRATPLASGAECLLKRPNL